MSTSTKSGTRTCLAGDALRTAGCSRRCRIGVCREEIAQREGEDQREEAMRSIGVAYTVKEEVGGSRYAVVGTVAREELGPDRSTAPEFTMHEFPPRFQVVCKLLDMSDMLPCLPIHNSFQQLLFEAVSAHILLNVHCSSATIYPLISLCARALISHL